MAARPVQISLDEALLQRIDADPQTKAKGRSAFIREAILRHLRAREREAVDEAIMRAYDGEADAMLSEIEDLMQSQVWPEP